MAPNIHCLITSPVSRSPEELLLDSPPRNGPDFPIEDLVERDVQSFYSSPESQLGQVVCSDDSQDSISKPQELSQDTSGWSQWTNHSDLESQGMNVDRPETTAPVAGAGSAVDSLSPGAMQDDVSYDADKDYETELNDAAGGLESVPLLVACIVSLVARCACRYMSGLAAEASPHF
ncbi:hypothetical protein DXG03_008307 [Asterophora parasitica]|uniref:Uncharacterized protein n=1 Tax=Asterophora parasitica TaxID=117018 RepID=A0A9P7G812_9AGAR|nr:hypothetical protein DXG03_008307 [Asterophora parasitica]